MKKKAVSCIEIFINIMRINKKSSSEELLSNIFNA